jgi:hypothetical protein
VRIVAAFVERHDPGAELERFLDVVRDHDDGEAVLLPQVRDQRVHVDAACPSSDEMGHFDDLRSEVLAHLV